MKIKLIFFGLLLVLVYSCRKSISKEELTITSDSTNIKLLKTDYLEVKLNPEAKKEVEEWKDLPLRQRGEKYENWKSLKADRLIKLVSEKFPELKGNIESYNVSTPLTLRDYIGTPDGGMYGTTLDFNNPMTSYVSPRTKIPNLFFTGQNVSLHGMLGVSLSSLMTCGEFIGINNLIKEVNEA